MEIPEYLEFGTYYNRETQVVEVAKYLNPKFLVQKMVESYPEIAKIYEKLVQTFPDLDKIDYERSPMSFEFGDVGQFKFIFELKLYYGTHYVLRLFIVKVDEMVKVEMASTTINLDTFFHFILKETDPFQMHDEFYSDTMSGDYKHMRVKVQSNWEKIQTHPVASFTEKDMRFLYGGNKKDCRRTYIRSAHHMRGDAQFRKLDTLISQMDWGEIYRGLFEWIPVKSAAKI